MSMHMPVHTPVHMSAYMLKHRSMCVSMHMSVHMSKNMSIHMRTHVDTHVQDSGFDRVFSNATLHWCSRDPSAVADTVHRVLVPGGRYRYADESAPDCCHALLAVIVARAVARAVGPEQCNDCWP